MTHATTTTSYDDVLYPNYVHAQTHPDRLATLATLYGMQPTAVERSRILELACGQGGNIIPLAVAFPGSQCLGIDLSPRQIDSGQQLVNSLGLTNIELRTQSILDFSAENGKFDYIIAHGVFSWVPEAVRDKILAICREHLSPNGVAFVSYNTFPGWHQRRMIRDMMRFHTKGFADPAKRIEQAKAFLTFMTKAVPDESAYGRSLHEEFRSLSNVDEAYLFHEQLEEVNEPKYFHEFAHQAASHGLQYLSEVELSNLQFERYPPQVAGVLKNMEIIEREQYLDFLMRRTFRQTLLCHQEVTLDRQDLTSGVGKLRVASCLLANQKPDAILSNQPLVVDTPSGAKITIGDAMTKTAFMILTKAWPNSIAISDLQSQVRKELAGGKVVVQSQDEYQRDTQSLIHTLTHAFIVGAVELSTIAPRFAAEVSATPTACPLARLQAAAGGRVTSRQHRLVDLDMISCHVLGQLDGATPLDVVLNRLVTFVIDQKIALQKDGNVLSSPGEIRELLEPKLGPSIEMLRRWALLVD